MEKTSKTRATAPSQRRRAGHADEQIHSEIYTAIMNHQIRPATPLPEDALAGAFRVSRTIIRKVLQRLAHEKLVEIVPNKGACVAKPTIDEARQVFEARRGVECILAAKLAKSITGSEVARLEALLKAEAAALAANDKQRRLQLSGQFHKDLATMAGNSVMAEFVHELVSRTSLIIGIFGAQDMTDCRDHDHSRIVDAIRRRDAEEGARLMQEHLAQIKRDLDLSGRATNALDLVSILKRQGTS